MNQETIKKSTNVFESGRAKKFVIFQLDNSTFGVDVSQVTQVYKFEKVYKIPGTPDYILGALNVRGKIISLVHLKKRLGLGDKLPPKDSGHILFVETSETIGMLVDKVINLVDIPVNSIKEELDLISTRIDMDFLKGAATIEDEIIILLNLDMVLSEYELEEITEHRERLQKALEEKEKIILDEDQIEELNLESDEFNKYSEEIKKD